jgi:TetR/AcrR family transcriptional regulator, transcriptional repressor for nem operon
LSTSSSDGAISTSVTGPKTKTPRRNDPQGLRGRILDVAAALFQTRGYHATSMQDLMKETRVTGGALHHHFPTKKSLALAVFKERVAVSVREAWIDPIRLSSSFGEGVSTVFARIIDGVERRGAVTGCPLNNLASELALADATLREAAGAIFTEWQDAIAARLQETRGGRHLSKPARAKVATFIVSAYSGAMALAKTEQGARPLREAAQALQDWLRVGELDG